MALFWLSLSRPTVRLTARTRGRLLATGLFACAMAGGAARGGPGCDSFLRCIGIGHSAGYHAYECCVPAGACQPRCGLLCGHGKYQSHYPAVDPSCLPACCPSCCGGGCGGDDGYPGDYNVHQVLPPRYGAPEGGYGVPPGAPSESIENPSGEDIPVPAGSARKSTRSRSARRPSALSTDAQYGPWQGSSPSTGRKTRLTNFGGGYGVPSSQR